MIRFLKLLIIPLLFVLGYCILLSYPYISSKINRYDSLGLLSVIEEKTLNLNKSISNEHRTDPFDNHLLKGEIISGRIKATENNFGIVLIKFVKPSVKTSDTIDFRIKREGVSKWYYEHTYDPNQFQDNQYFTFGFPNIADSKNHTYIFELESSGGTYTNSVALNANETHVALVYKFSKDDLKNYKSLYSFISKKINYVSNNVNFFLYVQLLAVFIIALLVFHNIEKRKISFHDIKNLLYFRIYYKKGLYIYFNENKYTYLSLEKQVLTYIKKIQKRFTSTKFYLLFLKSNTRKRLVIGCILFLVAFFYRYAASVADQSSLFYAGLGGQGDYDQFIRASTCAVTSFCAYAVLGQNFLFETTILGIFYKVFGFIGGINTYVYYMLILSAIVATLPYFLLSRKNWVSIGGFIGSILLATSDFLTKVALNFPPDNSSLFSFSMFYIVYFLTIQYWTVRWLLFLGFIGVIDGLNKALFIINDGTALLLFAPLYFFEKTLKQGESIFRKKNIKIALYTLIPLSIFLLIYIGWEFFVLFKFKAHYFIGGIILNKGASYITYTSFHDNAFTRNIIGQLFYLMVSGIIMLQNLIDYADFQISFLLPIFLGLLFFSYIIPTQSSISKIRVKFSIKKFISTFILSVVLILFFVSIKNDYYHIHKIFGDEFFSSQWTDSMYVRGFLFSEIILLFIINFTYTAARLFVPIIPYAVMLIFMAKNAPFARLHTHVVAWSIILLSYLIDFLLAHINKHIHIRFRVLLGTVLLMVFLFIYTVPKMVYMFTRFNRGISANQNQERYLRWVNQSIPSNAIILAGGKSDLIALGENINRPIIYSTLWTTALLIKPHKIPRISTTEFSITTELNNKDNFKKKKYFILNDDIYVWRSRVAGIADNLFTTLPTALINGKNYEITLYKSNLMLNKALYELHYRDIR